MKPFLKWAGNKYGLIERITDLLPAGARLIEPFVGSGAVFLNSDYDAYVLADANPDLINLFVHLRDEGEQFIDYCRSFFVPENNVNQRYYELRSLFNQSDDTRLKSALFVYMNRHCFNGLCRYNSKGGFNAPFGRYKRPYFPAKEMRNFHRRAQRATFVRGRFAAVMDEAVEGDVVYCDPPYVPLSSTAHFTSYSADKFGFAEQTALAQKAAELAARGIPVMISNHHTEFTEQAYAQAETHTFDVARRISCQATNRRPATEVLALFC